MDQSVGAVLRELERTGVADRTVVVLFSDNGGTTNAAAWRAICTSNAPLRFGKTSLYEGGIRVPMIVRWPGTVKPGSVCNTPVISNDFYPTMVEMAGIRKDPGNPIDGLSLVPLLKQSGSLRRETLYWYYPHKL